VEFARVLDGIVWEAGWQIKRWEMEGDRVNRDMEPREKPGVVTTVTVSMREVSNTWDKWPEEKQALGREKLQAYVADNLRHGHGMTISLNAGNWTPN
jgi:predicted RNA-binding Zn ribbon-like protein